MGCISPFLLSMGLHTGLSLWTTRPAWKRLLCALWELCVHNLLNCWVPLPLNLPSMNTTSLSPSPSYRTFTPTTEAFGQALDILHWLALMRYIHGEFQPCMDQPPSLMWKKGSVTLATSPFPSSHQQGYEAGQWAGQQGYEAGQWIGQWANRGYVSRANIFYQMSLSSTPRAICCMAAERDVSGNKKSQGRRITQASAVLCHWAPLSWDFFFNGVTRAAASCRNPGKLHWNHVLTEWRQGHHGHMVGPGLPLTP